MKKTKAVVKDIRADIVFDAELSGQPLRFQTTWGLFSPREIDEGTVLLLKYLKVDKADNCLDIGCGYGPIGVWMARNAPEGETHMVDKDFLAVEYSNTNAVLNKTDNAKAYLSNAFSHVPDMKFNTIVSNIPAKVGRELLTIILEDAKAHLADDGQLVVVTINGLRDFMKNNLKEVFGNYKKIKQGAKYTVARATMV